MKDKIAKLIDLKSIITLSLTMTLIWGFVAGKVEAKDFLVYVAMVFTFYFSKKEKGDENMATIDTRTEEEIKEDLKTVDEEVVEEKEAE